MESNKTSKYATYNAIIVIIFIIILILSNLFTFRANYIWRGEYLLGKSVEEVVNMLGMPDAPSAKTIEELKDEVKNHQIMLYDLGTKTFDQGTCPAGRLELTFEDTGKVSFAEFTNSIPGG